MFCAKYYFIQQQIFCPIFFNKVDNTIYFLKNLISFFLGGGLGK